MEHGTFDPKKLYRSERNRMIFGVCGGLAEYFVIDPTIIRVIFVVFGICGGSGILAYLIMALLIPKQ